MSYGLDAEKFLLAEGELYVGTFSAISYTNPEANFTGDKIGYFKQGSLVVNLTFEWAEFWSGTPAKIIRKDLVKKQFGIEVQLAQINDDLLKLIKGTDLVVDSTRHNHFIGSNEPVRGYNGFLLKTTLVDGSLYNICIWNGKVLPDDANDTLSGTEHATNTLKVTAFPDSRITNDNRCYGYIQEIPA